MTSRHLGQYVTLLRVSPFYIPIVSQIWSFYSQKIFLEIAQIFETDSKLVKRILFDLQTNKQIRVISGLIYDRDILDNVMKWKKIEGQERSKKRKW